MDKHHHDHGGGFMNGFLLGAIIGAAVVFFLFTEKGKKLLKTITEEGIEGFADLQDLVEEEMEDEEGYEDDMVEEEPRGDVEEVPHHAAHPKGTSFAEAAHSHVEPLHAHEAPHRAPGKVKRFFRGIKKG